jgi:hypothetical protein
LSAARYVKGMLLALALACSTTHGARPLGEGTVAVNLSAGGPVTALFGTNIPLPLSSVGAAYGVSDTLDVHGAVHTSAALLFGLPAGEVGAAWSALPQEGARPRVGVDATVVLAGGDIAVGGSEGGFRALLEPSVLAAWDLGADDRHTVYSGVGAMLQPWPGPNGYGWLTAGGRWGLGGDALGLVTEAKWLAPWASNVPMAPEMTGIAGRGALSVQVGLDARFGGAK